MRWSVHIGLVILGLLPYTLFGQGMSSLDSLEKVVFSSRSPAIEAIGCLALEYEQVWDVEKGQAFLDSIAQTQASRALRLWQSFYQLYPRQNQALESEDYSIDSRVPLPAAAPPGQQVLYHLVSAMLWSEAEAPDSAQASLGRARQALQEGLHWAYDQLNQARRALA